MAELWPTSWMPPDIPGRPKSIVLHSKMPIQYRAGSGLEGSRRLQQEVQASMVPAHNNELHPHPQLMPHTTDVKGGICPARQYCFRFIHFICTYCLCLGVAITLICLGEMTEHHPFSKDESLLGIFPSMYPGLLVNHYLRPKMIGL